MRALTHRSSAMASRAVLHRVNTVLRGWCNYFRHGVSKATFSHLDEFAWRRVTRWLRRRHNGLSWKTLARRFLTPEGVSEDGTVLFKPSSVPVIRYRWRGHHIPTPWTTTDIVS